MADSVEKALEEASSKAEPVQTDEEVVTTLKSVPSPDQPDSVISEKHDIEKSSGDDRSGIVESEDTDKHKDPSAALDRLVGTDAPGWGWSSLSSWGTSVLNTAATSVTSFKTQVGEGLHQVMETVESGLLESDTEDFKDAEENPTGTSQSETEIVTEQEMVRHGTGGEEPKADEKDEEEGWLSGWGIGGLPVLSDVVQKTSDIVQKTGSVVYQTVEKTTNVSKKVLTSGLDVLETISKKTYDALAEDENVEVDRVPENQPTLSQRLREAKEIAETRAKEEEEFTETRKSNFGAQFDDFQGLVQLEALESLFSSSEAKVRGFVEMLPKESADPLKSDLMHIKQIFDAVEDGDEEDAAEHNFVQLLTDYFGKLNLNVSVQNISLCQEKTHQWLSDCESALQQETSESKSAKEIHQKAIQSLAELTSCAIEHWRRVGQQLLLLQSSPASSIQSTATELAGLAKVLVAETVLQSAQFVNCLTIRSRRDEDSSHSELITSVYLEAGNAGGYIRNGFRLLLPVLQLAIINAHPLFKEPNN